MDTETKVTGAPPRRKKKDRPAGTRSVPSILGLIAIGLGLLSFFVPYGGLGAIAGIICGMIGLFLGIRMRAPAGQTLSRLRIVLPAAGLGMCAVTVAVAVQVFRAYYASLG